MADPIADNLSNPAQPKSVTTGAGTVVARSTDELIKADRYVNAKAARGKGLGGVIFCKILPAACPADLQGTNAQAGNFDSPGDA
jgi:hypothetical protein